MFFFVLNKFYNWLRPDLKMENTSFLKELLRIARSGSNTPQDTNCTATCPLSRKLFKLGEPDMQDIAGEAEMNS